MRLTRAKKWLLTIPVGLALILGSLPAPLGAQDAAAPAAAPAEPTIEQRVADIEAYMNNGARTPDVASKVAGPGPGHNAWQMVSTALVLFMTLPGLALFYGGLVRGRTCCRVLAQCLGIAGMVTILWWALWLQPVVLGRATPSSATSPMPCS